MGNARGALVAAQARALSLEGRVFTRLRVVAHAGNDAHGHVLWLCECACSQRVRVRAGSLTSGRTRSCGCLRVEAAQRLRRAA